MSSGATDFSGLEFLDGLDDEQREAALVLDDAVVSAGAGSGKTRVLTARYGAMIMSGRCGVEEILAITFTNKAANEMYRRIYSLLSRYAPSNEYARQAVESFHLARISTLDHFCAVTARTVCRRFGISPDFTSDEIRVRDLARSLALGFVLDKRDDPALRHLIAEKNIRSVTEELFVRPVLDHSPLSRPLDFAAFAELQRNEILERWNEHSRRADELTGMIRENYEWTAMENKNLSAALSLCRKAPDIRPLLEGGPDTEALRKQTGDYAAFLAAFRPVSIPKKKSETRTAAVREAVEELKKLRAVIEALANNALQWNIQAGVFPLVEEYQELLHRKKKEAGILTFTDIAHLAVDGLRQYGDIRRMYQDSLKMIMIDEFQDNNSLQRDLVELLAGPASVFYVGDEKQSIYRFRGADVSVFRGLADRDGRRMRSLVLNRNYRSHPDLIAAFNRIFGGFRNGRDGDPAGGLFPVREAGLKKYEASYRRALAAPAHNSVTDDSRPRLHFAFFDKGSLIEGDPLRAADHEALYVASQIRGIIDRSTPVKDKQSGVERPCRYGDVAVLERGRGSQRSLERALKQFGIPFGADRPAALFEDAPVNDLWALLKLLVYPEDRVAYGALLRSPLVRLGEEAFTLCMLRGGEIFDEALDGELPPPDRRRYREGRRLYRTLLADAGELSAAALITKLWYETGYRQEALWSAESQVYLDLYDLFFEQAQRMEERGQGLVDFLDYLEDLVRKDWGRGKEQISDSDLPGEEESGVRIMTIHRSKGLEFPVVFVYGGGSAENTGLEKGLALFSERRGIFLKLPAAEELEEGGNYFYLAEQDEHRDKTIAELRRILYVAMTRAEQELYFTAVIPPQSKADLKTLNPEIFGPDEFIVERLEQYRTSEKNSVSFLRLLPPLSAENPLYTIAPIPAYPAETWRRLASAASGRSGESLSMKEAARMIRGEYRAIPAVPFPRFVPQIAAASALRPAGSGLRPAAGPRPAAAPYPDGSGVRSFRPPGTEVRGVQGELDFDGMEPPAISAGGQRAEDAGAELDELLRAAGLSAQDFGIIVHGFIEDRFNGRTPRLPRRFAVENEQYLAAVGGAARTMAEGFFASALGRKAAAAPFLKTEYPLLSAADCGQGRIVISGKIDLLFDDGKTVYVVDFKTGLDEDITRHVGQLAVYRRAAEDLFRKPVECRLFYLRGSREADISAELDKTTVEELAEIWLRENG